MLTESPSAGGHRRQDDRRCRVSKKSYRSIGERNIRSSGMKPINACIVRLVHELLVPKYEPPKIGADTPGCLLRIWRIRSTGIGIRVFPSSPFKVVRPTTPFAN